MGFDTCCKIRYKSSRDGIVARDAIAPQIWNKYYIGIFQEKDILGPVQVAAKPEELVRSDQTSVFSRAVN